eukprot:9477636-Pyramimonas_sp.AAC.1
MSASLQRRGMICVATGGCTGMHAAGSTGTAIRLRVVCNVHVWFLFCRAGALSIWMWRVPRCARTHRPMSNKSQDRRTEPGSPMCTLLASGSRKYAFQISFGHDSRGAEYGTHFVGGVIGVPRVRHILLKVVNKLSIERRSLTRGKGAPVPDLGFL